MVKELNALVDIVQSVSGIKSAGLERGQFDNPSQNKPLLKPSALIDLDKVTYFELGNNEEDALIEFSVNLYFEGIQDIPDGNEHFKAIEALNKALKKIGCTRHTVKKVKSDFKLVKYEAKYDVMTRVTPENENQKIKPKVSITYVIT